MFTCNETQDFIDSAKSLGLTEEVKDFIRDWAKTFNRQETSRSKHYFRSSHNVFEIWAIRFADRDSKKGTSGGFRLICFVNVQESSNNLCMIERRNNIGGRRERPKDQQRYESYLRELKKQLIKALDSE